MCHECELLDQQITRYRTASNAFDLDTGQSFNDLLADAIQQKALLHRLPCPKCGMYMLATAGDLTECLRCGHIKAPHRAARQVPS
jgi:ribosomal protein L32